MESAIVCTAEVSNAHTEVNTFDVSCLLGIQSVVYTTNEFGKHSKLSNCTNLIETVCILSGNQAQTLKCLQCTSLVGGIGTTLEATDSSIVGVHELIQVILADSTCLAQVTNGFHIEVSHLNHVLVGILCILDLLEQVREANYESFLLGIGGSSGNIVDASLQSILLCLAESSERIGIGGIGLIGNQCFCACNHTFQYTIKRG